MGTSKSLTKKNDDLKFVKILYIKINNIKQQIFKFDFNNSKIPFFKLKKVKYFAIYRKNTLLLLVLKYFMSYLYNSLCHIIIIHVIGPLGNIAKLCEKIYSK